MANQVGYDPYQMFKKLSDEYEKQVNDWIHRSTNNREFVELLRWGSVFQAPYVKMFKKNQELFAKVYNLSTKTDVAKVAKLTLQTEEKVDALEEQLWKLEEKLDFTNKNINILAESSREIVKVAKQLKSDQKKINEIHTGLQELTGEFTQIYSLKEELAELKQLMHEQNDKQEQVLELTAASK